MRSVYVLLVLGALSVISAQAQSIRYNTKPEFEQINNTLGATAALNGLACGLGFAGACIPGAIEGTILGGLVLEESGIVGDAAYEAEIDDDWYYDDGGKDPTAYAEDFTWDGSLLDGR